MPAAIGGSVSGSSMRLSAISVAQRNKRRLVAGREGVACLTCPAIDLGPSRDRAPDQIGVEPDDRIAPPHRAALDRFEQNAHRPTVRDLEEGRHRRLEVGNQGGPHHLRFSPRIALAERG